MDLAVQNRRLTLQPFVKVRSHLIVTVWNGRPQMAPIWSMTHSLFNSVYNVNYHHVLNIHERVIIW